MLFVVLRAAGAADVTDVRVGAHPNKTRLVLELSEKVPYRIFTLADPYRVVIDLPRVDWKIKSTGPVRGAGVISSYRYGLFQKGNSRLVVDVRTPVALSTSLMLPPAGRHLHRLVVDLKAVSTETFAKSERAIVSKGWVDPKPQTALAVPGINGAKRPDGTGGSGNRRVVVIDPGHGGPDPGAIARSGVQEKAITLAVARVVRQVLEATGRYKVYLTRNEDIYVPLRRRFATAHDVGGELFISLHADANKDRRLRGATVYTLSEKSSDREAEALAAKENRSDAIAGIDLSHQSDAVASFLIELRQRETMNESAVFSEDVIRELRQDFRMLRNSHRFAGFAVLKSPDVPSILVELGYLSNNRDAKLLRKRNYQKKAAEAILRAADAYFKRKDRLSRS